MGVVCPGYTQALAFVIACLFWVQGACEGRCVPAIARLSPSCLWHRGGGVSWVYPGSHLCSCVPFLGSGGLRGSMCPGYSQALAFLSVALWGWCVLGIPRLSPLCLHSPFRVQGVCEVMCPGYSQALVSLFLFWVQGGLCALVCPGYSRAPAFVYLLVCRVHKTLYVGTV